jgi:hypothetical protein
MSSTLDPHILIPGAWMKLWLKARIYGGFIPEIGGLFQSCPHFTDAKPLPGLAIPEGPNVDGRRGFPTIVLASPIQAWPSPQSSTGCPVS